VVACVGFFAAVSVTLVTSTPVLGKLWSWPQVIAGAVFAILFGFWAVATFRSAPKSRGRVVVVSVLAVLLACFVAGALSSPVLVGGQVKLDTSTQARTVRYVTGMRDDLYTLKDLDATLALPDAQVWADPKQVEVGRKKAENIGLKYQTILDGDGPPAGQLADPTRRTLTAAYTMVQAYDLKAKLLKADDAKLRADLAAARTKFATELVEAGSALGEAVDALGYDITLTRDGQDGPR
jgi:hypothetical protein